MNPKLLWIGVMLVCAAAIAVPFIVAPGISAAEMTLKYGLPIMAAGFIPLGILYRRLWLGMLEKVRAVLPGGRWEGSPSCIYPLDWFADLRWDISADFQGRIFDFGGSGSGTSSGGSSVEVDAIPKWRDASQPFVMMTSLGGKKSLVSWEAMTAAGLMILPKEVPEIYRPLLDDGTVREAMLSAFRLGMNVSFFQGGCASEQERRIRQSGGLSGGRQVCRCPVGGPSPQAVRGRDDAAAARGEPALPAHQLLGGPAFKHGAGRREEESWGEERAGEGLKEG